MDDVKIITKFKKGDYVKASTYPIDTVEPKYIKYGKIIDRPLTPKDSVCVEFKLRNHNKPKGRFQSRDYLIKNVRPSNYIDYHCGVMGGWLIAHYTEEGIQKVWFFDDKKKAIEYMKFNGMKSQGGTFKLYLVNGWLDEQELKK